LAPIGLLEVKVLAALLKRKTYLKHKTHLSIQFFRSQELRVIFRTIVRLHDRFKVNRINLTDVWLLLEKKVNHTDHSRYKKLLLKIKDQYLHLSEEDTDVLEYSITRFAQESILKQTLSARVQELESGQEVDLGDLKTQVDKILSLDSGKKIDDYNYMAHLTERMDIEKEPVRIPTGISQELDLALSGGLAQGELGFFLAPPGRGKTLALVNIGTNALKQGKRVLHVTLEIRARAVGQRYDCCISESSKDEIRKEPEELIKKLKDLKKKGGELVIRDYSYIHCGISELNALLEEKKNANTPVDVLIVDYADLMIPPSRYRDTRHEVTKIYEELRILAGFYDIPVWTASQGNRVSLMKPKITMVDIAESFAKANIADLIIALCQTEEEKYEKEMRLYIAKTRMGETNPTINVIADLKRMVMRSPNNYDREVSWNKPNLEKVKQRVRNKE